MITKQTKLLLLFAFILAATSPAYAVVQANEPVKKEKPSGQPPAPNKNQAKGQIPIVAVPEPPTENKNAPNSQPAAEASIKTNQLGSSPDELRQHQAELKQQLEADKTSFQAHIDELKKQQEALNQSTAR